jgi:tRNA A37 methylthiotransferase MiaB
VAAERWEDDVPLDVKRRRINELLGLQRQIAARRTARWIGRTAEVLIEGSDELGRPFGRTRQGKRTAVKRALLATGAGLSLPIAGQPDVPRLRPGQLVRVTIEEATPGQLAGPVAA